MNNACRQIQVEPLGAPYVGPNVPPLQQYQQTGQVDHYTTQHFPQVQPVQGHEAAGPYVDRYNYHTVPTSNSSQVFQAPAAANFGSPPPLKPPADFNTTLYVPRGRGRPPKIGHPPALDTIPVSKSDIQPNQTLRELQETLRVILDLFEGQVLRLTRIETLLLEQFEGQRSRLANLETLMLKQEDDRHLDNRWSMLRHDKCTEELKKTVEEAMRLFGCKWDCPMEDMGNVNPRKRCQTVLSDGVDIDEVDVDTRKKSRPN